MSVQVSLFDKTDLKPSKVAARVEEIVGGGFDVKKFVENFAVLVDAPAGIERMRSLILDLGIRGILTAGKRQPAELSRQGGESETFTLPEGWKWAYLGELGQFINGDRSKNYPSKEHQVESGIPFINAGHLKEGAVDQTEMNFISEDRFALLRSGKVQEDDILYCLRGSLGKAAVVRGVERGAIASSLVIIRLRDQHDPSYVYAYLTSPFGRRMILKYDNGTAQPNLSATDVARFLVPVPPLAEQKRIVAKVDQLMALCDDLEARHTKRREVGTRLTKSALEALTTAEGPEEFDAAWKRVVENFDVLIGTAESVRLLRQSVIDLGVGRLAASPPEASIRDLATETRYGTARKCGSNTEETPVLRIPNVVRGILDLQDLKYTKFPAGELEDLRLCQGDLLVVRSNGSRDLVGRSAVVDKRAEGFAFAGYLIRVRLRTAVVLPAWVKMAMDSTTVRRAVEGPARTTSGVHNVNSRELLSLSIPVPSLALQRDILQTVGQLMKVCDALEAKLRQAEDRAGKLVEAAVQELVAGEPTS